MIDMTEEQAREVQEDDRSIVKMEDFTSPDELYQELVQRVTKYHPSADISMIEKAYQVAKKAHDGQVRKSGEPYIIHPLCVAIILADLELDKESIAAGLLHDVVEDTPMTTEDLAKEFGDEVALLVDGVTKLGQLSYSADKVDEQAENLRKMFLAMAKDGGPASQYAYAEIHEAGKAEGKSTRDHGHLCAHCTASWYFESKDRAG